MRVSIVQRYYRCQDPTYSRHRMTERRALTNAMASGVRLGGHATALLRAAIASLTLGQQPVGHSVRTVQGSSGAFRRRSILERPTGLADGISG